MLLLMLLMSIAVDTMIDSVSNCTIVSDIVIDTAILVAAAAMSIIMLKERIWREWLQRWQCTIDVFTVYLKS